MKKQWPVRALSRALSSSTSSSTTTTTMTNTASFPLKHVTKSNFESALSSLSDHVRASDFVAIDLEMTGVTSAPWRDSFEFDRFDVWYLKVKDSAEKFATSYKSVDDFLHAGRLSFSEALTRRFPTSVFSGVFFKVPRFE